MARVILGAGLAIVAPSPVGRRNRLATPGGRITGVVCTGIQPIWARWNGRKIGFTQAVLLVAIQDPVADIGIVKQLAIRGALTLADVDTSFTLVLHTNAKSCARVTVITQLAWLGRRLTLTVLRITLDRSARIVAHKGTLHDGGGIDKARMSAEVAKQLPVARIAIVCHEAIGVTVAAARIGTGNAVTVLASVTCGAYVVVRTRRVGLGVVALTLSRLFVAGCALARGIKAGRTGHYGCRIELALALGLVAEQRSIAEVAVLVGQTICRCRARTSLGTPCALP